MFACASSVKDWMGDWTMPVRGEGSGFSATVVLLPLLLGEKLGLRFLVYLSGPEATQCPRNFGSSPHHSSIQFVGPITPLYNEPYEEINWWRVRRLCAKEDAHYPHTLLQTLMWDSLYFGMEPLLNRWPFKKIREYALKKTMEHIHYEDENSRYITIGCIEKSLMMLACWIEDPSSEAFKKHLSRIADYIWVGEDGIKIQSFGSQVWDCVLSLQAILTSNLIDETGAVLKKGHKFLKDSQLDRHPSGDFKKMLCYISKGAYGPFQIKTMDGSILRSTFYFSVAFCSPRWHQRMLLCT